MVEDPSLPAGQINVTLSGTYSGPGTSETGIDEPLPDVNDAEATGSAGTDGPGGNVGTPGTDATGGDVLGENEAAEGTDDSVGAVGTPEESVDPGADDATETADRGAIDAGGDGPMCIN